MKAKYFLSYTVVVALFSLISFSCSEEATTSPIKAEASFTAAAKGTGIYDRYTYTFTPTVANASGHIWEFGDGETSTDVTASHTYANAGNYTVKLKVWGVPGSGEVLGPYTEITQNIVIEIPSAEDLIEGTWVPYQMSVAWADDVYEGAWWHYKANDDACCNRPWLDDDTYTFNKATGTFSINHGTETWLENWQSGSGDFCGAPVAPYINGDFSYEVGANGSTLKVIGDGAYIMLPKAHNAGDNGDETANLTITDRTYILKNVNTTDLILTLNYGAGDNRWNFHLKRQ